MYTSPIELLQKISPLLQEPLDYGDMDNLRKQLSELQSVRYEFACNKSRIYETLLNKREQVRMPKGKEYTEFDRKVMSGAAIAVIEADYQLMIDLEQIITERVSLGSIFLQTM